MTGLSASILDTRDALIRSTIEEYAKASYVLLGQIVNVGVAMLVYAKDSSDNSNDGGSGGIARRVRDVETTFSACGSMWMGNKGAVGIRFRVMDDKDESSPGEIFTYVGLS